LSGAAGSGVLDAVQTGREKDKMRVKLDKGAYMPERAHEDDAGYDIRTPFSITVPPFTAHNGPGKAIIHTGIHVEVPKGHGGMLNSKSGLNIKDDIIGEGVIDVGYTGEIVVKLYNLGTKEHHFEPGDKIIQLVFGVISTPDMELVDELGNKLGLALAQVSCVVDPEVFVIGGGVSRAGDILINAVKAAYQKYAFHACKNTGFELATLGNDAGMYGGAYLATK
jgi:deoxyuridine 5'-triphosphate nucleotidohydrolase